MKKFMIATVLVGLLSGAQAYANVVHQFKIDAEGMQILNIESNGITAKNNGCTNQHCYFQTEFEAGKQGSVTLTVGPDASRTCQFTLNEGLLNGIADPEMENINCSDEDLDVDGVWVDGDKYVLFLEDWSKFDFGWGDWEEYGVIN